MPTVLREGPYWLYFYSHEPNEPPHVHVDRDAQTAKYWLQPVSLAAKQGSASRELGRIEGLVMRRRAVCLEARYGHFER